MRIVAMSDSHNQHRRVGVPDGDVLIHAGDITCDGRSERHIRDFGDWLREQRHTHKIVIAGNHDRDFEEKPAWARFWLGGGIIYLHDESVVIEGFKFWGSPYTPAYAGWAFQLHGAERAKAHWAAIPIDVDVLVTHGPPAGVCDNPEGQHVGCPELRAAYGCIQPFVHVFGHIHTCGGQTMAIAAEGRRGQAPVHCFNVAVCADGNKMARGCTVIDI